jgi:putative spermidine/putrescine transport system permease protein
MRLSRRSRLLLRGAVGLTLLFIYIPLAVIAVYAFSSATTLEWPPPGFTVEWFGKAVENEGARDAVVTSVEVGLIATGVALVLGTLASLAVARYRFFGRETISFLVILPIALPGIVTGIALNSTVVVGHATFCIVVVYNNAIARLRRTSASFEEASADLGAHTWQTFRHVTLPNLRTALVAGALLAFALSFDEIIVTTFTIGAGQETLPIWFFNNFARPNNLPIVNVVAVFVIVASMIPVYLAHRFTRDEEGAAGARGVGVAGGDAAAEATAAP